MGHPSERTSCTTTQTHHLLPITRHDPYADDEALSFLSCVLSALVALLHSPAEPMQNIEQELTVIVVWAIHAELYSEGVDLCAEERSLT